MTIVFDQSPTVMVARLVIKYSNSELDKMAEAMVLYLEEDGQALLNLFMEPETRMLAADATNLLRKMTNENLHRLIDLLDDHIGKIYADEAQAEEAEYHAEVLAWVERNPEARV
jgi:hypothetical protein